MTGDRGQSTLSAVAILIVAALIVIITFLLVANDVPK